MSPRYLVVSLVLGGVLAFGPLQAAKSDIAFPSPGPMSAPAHVRVIVYLHVPGLEAARSEADEAAQRARIADVQDRLLRDLSRLPLGTVTRFGITPGVALDADATTISLLARHPLVRAVEEDRLLAPALLESTALIGAPSLWAGGSTGAGQTVALVDTGVDDSHPFLAGRVVSQACYGTTTISRFSLCDNGITGPGSAEACAFPGCDHGTQVAGIAAGNSDSFKGVAPEASIIAIKVYVLEKATGRLLALTSDVILGLERVYELREAFDIAAVNLSMSSYPPGESFFPESEYCDFGGPPGVGIIDRLADAGIATIVPSGNNDSAAGIAPPACHYRAVSVGSTRDGGPDALPADMVSPFSNSGPLLKLLAPGEWIYSSIPGGLYRRNAGTSLAAAHVTGAWALLKARAPEAGVDRILNALRRTGRPVIDSRNGVVTPRIEVAAAARELEDGCRYSVEPLSVRIGSAPATGQFRIETAGHCDWDITAASSTLSFSRTSGIAPATIDFAVTTNPTSTPRVSAALIAGQMFTVVQEPCLFDIAPALAVEIGNQAAQGEITVITEPHCPWSIRPSEFFPLEFLDGTDRVGSGAATWTVPTNTQPTPREYWASVGPAYIQVGVLQAAAPLLRLAPSIDSEPGVDLVWQNRTEGWLAAWMMNGLSVAASDLLSPSNIGDPHWRIAAAADLDADDKLDLVWQEDTLGWVAVWKMDGPALVASLSTSVPRVGDTQWKIVAAQDFNDDRKADLVWQHQTGGEIALWYMDGPTVVASELFTPGRLADTHWKIEAVADFSSDGKPDLLFRHQVEGSLMLWLLDGRTRVGIRDVAAPHVSDNWRIAAVGDLNRDNMPDLVWQDAIDGWIVAWLMDGSALMQVVALAPDRVADVNWQIVGPK